MISLHTVRPSNALASRSQDTRVRATVARPSTTLFSRKISHQSHKRSMSSGRKSIVVSASDDAEKTTESSPEPATPKPVQDENVPGFSATTGDGKELTVGPVGTALLWALLIVLFGLSLFFTFARAFLPDLEGPAIMDELAYINPAIFKLF